MPLCSKCSNPMLCSCSAPPKPLGGVVEPCVLKDGALWVHVMDDAGGNVKDAEALKNGGDKKPTDGNGLATYDPLPAGPYTASLAPLSVDLKAKYVPPGKLEQPATVSPGQITYVGFELKRKAKLKVKVVHATDPARVFGAADVSVADGPDKPPADKTAPSGVHDYTEKFGLLLPGPYKLKSALGEEDAKQFATVKDFTKETHDVDLAAGEDRTVVIEVEPKNLVAPKIELEYKVVLLDRKLSTHLTDKETPFPPTATRVELSFTESDAAKPEQSYSGTHKYDKGGVFTCPADQIEVYLDEACTQKLPASGELTPEQLPSGGKLSLYLRGIKAGTFQAKLALKDSTDRFIRIDKKDVEEPMGVVEIEMKLHHYVATDFDGLTADPDLPPPGGRDYDPLSATSVANEYHADLLKKYHKTLNDLLLPDQKPMTDQQKIAGKGRVLGQQTGTGAGNQARAKLVVQKLVAAQWPAGTDDYQIYINRTNSSGAVAIFDADWEGAEKPFPVSEGLKVSALKAADKTFWVEGKTATGKPADVRLDMALDREEGGLAKEVKRNADCARFTVAAFKELKVDYKVEADKPVRWDEAQSRFHVNLTGTGAGALTKDQARTVTLGAQLTQAVAGVKVHFMLAPDKNNQKAANGGVPFPPGGRTKWDSSVALTLEGPDAACFQIRNSDELFIVDGITTVARKKLYQVLVVGRYSDGSIVKLKKYHWTNDGEDTTAGVYVDWINDTDFTQTEEKLWKWDTIGKAVKHKDKTARDKYLHLSALTDDKGYAKVDVLLSRGGGDIFQPACYVDQDPHLAKYVEGHTDLEKKKPFFAAKKITVWRKFWVKKVAVEGLTSPDFEGAIKQYTPVMAEMIQDSNLEVKRSVVEKYSKKGIYPQYMCKVGGSDKEVLLVSALNKTWFFNSFKPEALKPNMIPILVCDYQWDPHPDGNTAAVSSPKVRPNAFPVTLDVGKYAIDPPVQGGTLLVSGKWKAQEWSDVTNDWGPEREGNLVAGDLWITKGRDSLTKVSVQLPAGCGATHASRVWIENLVVKAAKSYLGESFDKKILAVYDPDELDDFQNTIAHEIGHAYAQVVRGNPDGNFPEHANQADKGQGNHCRHLVHNCVMYDSGPVRGSLNAYCKICHPYLLWQDMSTIG